MFHEIDDGITASHFGFVDGEDVWYLKLVHSDIDIYVAGDRNFPDQGRVQLANLVLKNLQALEQQAIKYLWAFIDQRAVEGQTTWIVGVIECGKLQSDPMNEFTLNMYLESDPYGEWYVSFHHYPDDAIEFYPFAFGRKAI